MKELAHPLYVHRVLHPQMWLWPPLVVFILLSTFGLSACSKAAHRSEGLLPLAPFADHARKIEEGTPSERYHAMIRLLRYDDQRILDILLQGLQDPDPRVRYASAWVLKEGSQKIFQSEGNVSRAVEVLTGRSGGLDAGDMWVRTQLIKVLYELKKQDIAQLRQEIADAMSIKKSDLGEDIISLESIPDKSVRITVTEKREAKRADERRRRAGIGTGQDSGDVLLKALLELAEDRHPYIRQAAVQALFLWRDDPRAQSVREAAFQDRGPLIRQASLFGGFEGSWELNLMVFINGNQLVAPNSASRRALRRQVQEQPVLKQMVRDENQNIRRIMASILRALEEDPEARDLLIERLGDPSGQVVFEAINWLGQLREKRALDPLLDLQNGGWKDQPALLDAIGAVAGQPVKTVLTEHEGEPRRNIEGTAAIDRQSPADVSRHLETIVTGDRLDRLTAVAHLTWVEDATVEEALFRALGDPDPEVRWAAVGALTRYPMPSTRDFERIVNSLMALAEDSNPHVRDQAISSLGIFLESEKYGGRLLDYFQEYLEREADPFVKASATSTLNQLLWSRSATRILIKLLADDFPLIRREAIRGINAACAPEATGPLLQALRDPETEVRKAAAAQLQWASGRNVVKALKNAAANDPAKAVSEAASSSLGSIEYHSKNRKEALQAACRP